MTDENSTVRGAEVCDRCGHKEHFDGADAIPEHPDEYECPECGHDESYLEARSSQTSANDWGATV